MDLLARGIAIGMGLETLSCNEVVPINYEQTLFQALVNEGRVLNANRPQFAYNEKQLRDAAAAEVAVHGLYGSDDLNDKSSRKRKHMNADEKAKQNRDRNREHAKNTRLRKKAYVLKLKELVDQMNGQKDMEERERRALGERIHDTHIIRKNAVRLMLSYRAANMRDREKWAAILDEGFVFTLPITPYRSFHKSDIVSSSRVIVGVDAAIADAASLALMVESVGLGTDQWKNAVKRGQSCRITYTSSKDDMLAAGDLIMCRYVLRTEGFDNAGAVSPCVQHGMLQCRFNKQNKMVAAEMMFDVMGFMQQLQRASAISPENSIVPNTIDMALQPSREARAIIKAEPPFAIMHINEPWTAMSGMSQVEAEGRPLSDSLRLHSSQEEQIYALAADCSIGSAGSAILMTHSRTAQKEPALIYLKLTPLTSNTDVVSHFMGVQIELPLSRAEVAALLTHCNSTPTTYLSTSSSSSSSSNSSNSGKAGDPNEYLDNEERAKGRIHGEILYQYQQKQYQLHQERISELQMQQAYCSLSTTTQDTYSSQVGGSYDDRGCSAAHSLCIPDEPQHIPMGGGSLLMDRERGRELSPPATLQQQQMQLLEMQLAQKQQKQLEQQQHVKDEYAAGQRAVRAPSSSTSSSSQFINNQNGNQCQWAAQRHLLSSTVSADSVNDRDHRSDSSSGAAIAITRYESYPQQDMVNLRSVSHDGSGSSISKIMNRADVEKGSGSGSNNNSSNDDEKGPTWYKNASNTSSV